MNRRAIVFAVGAFALPLSSIYAADVVVQPSSGSGFVIKDAAGVSERMRVQESGAISLPGIASAPAQSQSLCAGAGGQLGPCGSSGGSSYTSGTGLALAGTTFSVAPTYQLPQSCAPNQIAQWNGTAWACGSAGGTLPAGTANQTLRYDASNTLVATDLLRVFSDGGLVAAWPGTPGSVPTTGNGIRMMWYPFKAAFRAGFVEGSQWDEINIGGNSAAFGRNTTASGFDSIATGMGSTAMGDDSVAMGLNARASDNGAVAMGSGAIASGGAAVALGQNTVASYPISTAIGLGTHAYGVAATAMGNQSQALAPNATAMGYSTIAQGVNSTAMGSNTVADGRNSTAMGTLVSTNHHTGSFIYGDASRTIANGNSADNQFMVVADGGTIFYSNSAATAGVKLASGGGSWTAISDRNAKTAVYPVNGREVLEKVAAMPLNTWQYKAQGPKYRHMGPMAQDFYAAFHLGESDTGIDTIDADGVALAAIQGLYAELNEKNREIVALRSELETQKSHVAALESLAGDFAEMKVQIAALRNMSTSAKMTAVSRQP